MGLAAGTVLLLLGLGWMAGAILYTRNRNKAVESYDDILSRNQSNLQAWNNKAYALEKQGKYNEAVKAYDVAIRLDPNDAAVWNNKGIAPKAIGRTADADVAFANYLGFPWEYSWGK